MRGNDRSRIDPKHEQLLMHDTSQQTGFTLIEALVALVIIAVGLLGLLGLQTAAIVSTDNAGYLSRAQVAADGMADRIRANPAPAARPVYQMARPADAAGAGSDACLGAGSPCAPPALAGLDRREWQNIVQRSLPNGQGFVDCAVGDQPCPVFDITVGWRERDTPGVDDAPGIERCASPTHRDAIGGPCLVTQVRP